MQNWKLLYPAALVAGMVACAMVGSGEQRQSTRPRTSPASNAETADSQKEKPDPRAEITREKGPKRIGPTAVPKAIGAKSP